MDGSAFGLFSGATIPFFAPKIIPFCLQGAKKLVMADPAPKPALSDSGPTSVFSHSFEFFSAATHELAHPALPQIKVMEPDALSSSARPWFPTTCASFRRCTEGAVVSNAVRDPMRHRSSRGLINEGSAHGWSSEHRA